MRFFTVLNTQHVILYIMTTLLFILVFGLALSYGHWVTRDAEERKKRILYRFPDGIEDRNAPFPLAIALIIAGTLVWTFFYILGIGLLGVKI